LWRSRIAAGSVTAGGQDELRILAESAYPLSAPSPRVRIAAFAPRLRSQGIELDFRPICTEAEYAAIASTASPWRASAAVASGIARSAFQARPAHDVLMIHRLRLLLPVPVLDPPAAVDVYDFDDALYLSSAPSANGRFAWVKREAERCVTYIDRARLVIAGNNFLADFARRRQASRVEVVPTCVDPASQALHEHRESEVATVGWIGSRTTSPYLSEVLPVFEQLNSSRLRAKLVLVGADPSLTAPWLEHRPWSLATEKQDLASFDIGIMPLPDTDWARGKCGYKLLQYFSAGVPAVASAVGVAPDLVGQDRGILVRSATEWSEALMRLLGDLETRRQTGLAARRYVEQHYSYQRWAPELAAILRSL
jgi:glycosyltransferase involved in cell wall biosynthesis